MAIDFEKRRAGVLLHLTSLPSTLGNGTMGKQAYLFVDFLKDCGLSVWQVLPIHPPQNVLVRTYHRDFLSPYQPQSVHAGNPMLINLQRLIDKGWLPKRILPSFNNQDQLEQSFKYRHACLKKASIHFFQHAKKGEREAYQQFVEENSWWLDDYALFRALKYKYQNACWWNWFNKDHRHYGSQALVKTRKRLKPFIELHYFIQFAFFTQWQELKKYANQNGVYLFGDMPFFAALDSVDVWSKRDNFLLDKEGKPLFFSGVPAEGDHFYPDKGQCWGHPLYNWENIQKEDFKWWIARFKKLSRLFDLVRLTHFRGFHQCWAIPAESSRPVDGNWKQVPGEALFKKLQEEKLLDSPILVAEDIGASDEVIRLRNDFHLLGVNILQLAFDIKVEKPLKNYHLPHHHKLRNVIYTGTHDSDTIMNWSKRLEKNKDKQKCVCEYLGTEINLPWSLIQAAFKSAALLSVIPMQDLLNLDARHRMNTPGTSNSRNWRWQFEWSQITSEIKNKIKEIVERYERN